MNILKIKLVLLLASATLLLNACSGTSPRATTSTAPDTLDAALASSYRAKGQAGMDRLQRSSMQQACSSLKDPDEAQAAKLREAAQASVKFPADGQYLGDWKAGKALAGIGTGMQFSDDPQKPNGGNCYACHQLEDAELGYGTLGPSLKGYGKIYGNSEAVYKYVWTRLYNPHAFNACSHMPRFGDAGILTEQQMKDVMALLFDPASPVNQ